MKDDPVICADCGYVGIARLQEKGSKALERLLWWVLLLPGPFYSLWRKTGRKRLCVKCGSKNLVSFDTAQGQKILERNLAMRETNRHAR